MLAIFINSKVEKTKNLEKITQDIWQDIKRTFQYYCIYVPLESQVRRKNWWFAGSQKGSLKLDVEPGSSNKCC